MLRMPEFAQHSHDRHSGRVRGAAGFTPPSAITGRAPLPGTPSSVDDDAAADDFGSGMNAFADGDKHDEDETLCDGDSLSGGGFGLGLGSSTHSVDDDATADDFGSGMNAFADGDKQT